MRDFRDRKIAKPRRWTQGALDCFSIGCQCRYCPIKVLLGRRKCEMKGAVVELVRLFGKPETLKMREFSL